MWWLNFRISITYIYLYCLYAGAPVLRVRFTTCIQVVVAIPTYLYVLGTCIDSINLYAQHGIAQLVRLRIFIKTSFTQVLKLVSQYLLRIYLYCQQAACTNTTTCLSMHIKTPAFQCTTYLLFQIFAHVHRNKHKYLNICNFYICMYMQ